MTLYELKNDYAMLFAMLEEAEETGDEDMRQAAMDTLESLEDDLNTKIENTVCYLKGVQGDIDAIDVEQKRLAKNKQTLQNRVVKIKTALQAAMESAQVKKGGGVRGEARIQANPPKVVFTDETYFRGWCEKYERYQRYLPVEIDMQAVMKDLKKGELLVGVELRQDKGVRIL